MTMAALPNSPVPQSIMASVGLERVGSLTADKNFVFYELVDQGDMRDVLVWAGVQPCCVTTLGRDLRLRRATLSRCGPWAQDEGANGP